VFCLPDSRTLHPLHFAALNDDLPMIQLLVDNIKETNKGRDQD